MTLNYRARDCENRIAEIGYNENENELKNRLFFFLERIKGWEVNDATDGWAYIIVDDKAEYELFKTDYKKAKKMLSNCIKFGF